MTEVTWKDSGLDSIASLKGKKVGVWLGGNEHKLFAALNKNDIDPQSDVEVVAQPFDMNLFLNREVDAAAAMTYNELAQVLEQENPDTGELYTLDDLNVLKMSDQGTGALEDGVFVRGDWIRGRRQPGHRDAVPERPASRAGSSVATTRTSASRSCSTTGRRSARGTRTGS